MDDQSREEPPMFGFGLDEEASSLAEEAAERDEERDARQVGQGDPTVMSWARAM